MKKSNPGRAAAEFRAPQSEGPFCRPGRRLHFAHGWKGDFYRLGNRAGDGDRCGVAFLLFLYSMRNEKISDDLMTSFQQSFRARSISMGRARNPTLRRRLSSSKAARSVSGSITRTFRQAMKDAVVAIEDKRFWQHKGVDCSARWAPC